MDDHRPTHQPNLVAGMLVVVSDAMRDSVQNGRKDNPIVRLLRNWRTAVDWALEALRAESWRDVTKDPPPTDRDVLLYYPPTQGTPSHPNSGKRAMWRVGTYPGPAFRPVTHWKELYVPETSYE